MSNETNDPRTVSDAAGLLSDWLAAHRAVFVLTGAGISTESGIPDYRDAAGEWKRRAPVTWKAFLDDPAARARYWARSVVGWPLVGTASPNRAHAALAILQARGRLSTLVTQNVDGLHQRAGHRDVIDLHGRIDRVVCLACGQSLARADMQQRLVRANPQWQAPSAAAAPDGDADLDGMDVEGFHVPACPHCAGLLKPDVVFFGDNVPRDRVQDAADALARSDAMLVVGSSLMVYSGYRYARMAREAGLPLAILTRGVTRADPLATLKLHAECGAVLADAVGLST